MLTTVVCEVIKIYGDSWTENFILICSLCLARLLHGSCLDLVSLELISTLHSRSPATVESAAPFRLHPCKNTDEMKSECRQRAPSLSVWI